MGFFQRIYDGYASLKADFKEVSTIKTIFTIKQGVTILMLFFIFLTTLFFNVYIYYGEYISAISTFISTLITIFLMVFYYNSPSYTKILISWFYVFILILCVVLTMLYGWDSGAGLYLINLMSFNYFLSVSSKKKVVLIAACEIIFFGVFFYSCLEYFPNGITPASQNFIYAIYLLICSSIIFGTIICVGIYALIVSNSIKRLELENESLANNAKYDYLTGLLNRHEMESLITLENLQKRGVNSFALIIGDVDHFKKVNDAYTHACGDLVLQKVSKSLLKSFRVSDKVCRWGGEEFMVFCENVTFDHANILLERTRKSIVAQKIYYEDKLIRVSMTFGAVFCDDMSNYNKTELIKQADMLLLMGKNMGRNRVVLQRV